MTTGKFLITAAAGACSLVLLGAAGPALKETTMTSTLTQSPQAPASDAIRPFQFHASDEALADLRRRIAATQWPDKETVADATQGVQLATMQKLARYWVTGYDWRKVEARLNALPQFITQIDGLDIHFINEMDVQPIDLRDELR